MAQELVTVMSPRTPAGCLVGQSKQGVRRLTPRPNGHAPIRCESIESPESDTPLDAGFASDERSVRRHQRATLVGATAP